MSTTDNRTNIDYTNPRRRRASLPGSLESIPRLTRTISGSFASTSAQALDWLNNQAKIQTNNIADKCHDLLRSRSRGYSVSGRPAHSTHKPSDPKFLGKDIYGFCLPKSSENHETKTRGRTVLDKIFPPLSDQPRPRSSSLRRRESLRISRPISRSGLGLENHSVMRESIGQFDYPVRCDSIDSIAISRSPRIQTVPIRPRRPSEADDVDLVRLQRETYGIKTPVAVRRPVRPTRDFDREIASMQSETYGYNLIPTNQAGNEDLDELSYVGLIMNVDKRGNITRRTDDTRHLYPSR
ncbi:hypothetical protein DFH28DRAFT_951165 [Melampsora americana]|nr:hypothetical protein DFH28DRAFT_951165 [Melampsora americana]